ncbi:TRAP transporter small permease [Breoghania sp. L-A4]|uniref:TRAP transporter small permease n=1 Tax=Breoghania sp. L-A4 TaxID=2304600 RepID=UPI000E35BB59|nr:TRAP transporter small permease [Breoghania sp. L-A4]AXS39411.1 TRAP transporter small permease [Breoghania sp. L-A4]
MIQLLDRLSAALGVAAAVAYFAIGLMLGYEVFARYLFTAPTIWAEELSRLLLVWGTFAAAAILLHRRQHIRITILTDRLPHRGRQLQEILALLFIGGFAAAVVWYGTPLAFDSFERGRTTGSMLDIPIVWMEAAVPVGCALLCLQALAEILQVALHGPAPISDPADVAH